MGLSNCGILSKKNGDYFFLINLTILRREAKKKEERKKISLPVTLALKAPITTAADDIHKYFIIVWQRIHMKNQALFSLKDKSNKIKCRLLQLLFGARQTKLVMAYGLRDADYFRMQWFTIGDWRWLPIYLFQLSVQSLKYRLYKGKSSIHVPNGRTHGVPYRGYGYVPLRFGGGGGGGGAGGTSLGEWEHNNNMYLAAVGTVGIRSTQHMKGGANPFSFSALCYLDSNQIPIHCWDDRDFQSPDGDP